MIGEKVNDYIQDAMNQRAEDPVTFKNLNTDDLRLVKRYSIKYRCLPKKR